MRRNLLLPALSLVTTVAFADGAAAPAGVTPGDGSWTAGAAAIARVRAAVRPRGRRHAALNTGTTTQGGSPYAFSLEPDTGSVWIFGSFDLGDQVVAEWQADGALVGTSGPFSPFPYRSPRSPVPVQVDYPAMLGGRFGILADYRGMYSRAAGGGFTLAQIFTAPGYLGCNETDATAACLFADTFIDGRGIPAALVLDEAQAVHALYWDGGAYRPARGVERTMEQDSSQFYDPTRTLWSADAASALVLTPSGNGSADITYRTYTAAGAVSQTVSADMPIDTFSATAVRAGPDVFLTVLNAGGTGPGGYLLYRLTNAFGTSPALVSVPLSAGAAGVAMLVLDGTHAYYASADHLYSQPLAGGAAADLGACPATGVSGMQLASLQAVDAAPWIACGRAVRRLAGGVVTTEISASAEVTGGGVLQDEGGTYDVALSLSDGTFARLRSGAADASARLLPLPPPPGYFAALWEEASGPCGAAYQGASVYCRVSGVWQATDLGIGVPQAVERTPDAWWAMTAAGDKAQLQRRADGGAWEKLGEWPAAAAPTLVRNGTGGIAVDHGQSTLAVVSGDQLSEAYPHPRSTLTSLPGIAADGLLYDLCPTSDQTGTFLCAVSADGTSRPVTGVPPVQYTSVVAPLKRGALVQVDNHYFVVRDVRAIAIGHLYGAFLPLPNQYASISVAEAGGGEVVITLTITDTSNFAQTVSYFTFDGDQLVPASVSPSRHRLPNGGASAMAAAAAAKARNVPVPQPAVGGYSLPQVWLGVDGIWRSASYGQSEPLAYGKTPVDALFGRESVAPDYVNGALIGDDAVVMATDDGIWTCPLANATAVSPETASLAQTPGCARQAALPYVRRLVRTPDGYLAQQGRRIVRMTSLAEASVTTVSGALTAARLSADGRTAAWTEGQTLVTYDLASGARGEVALPQGTGAVVAVAGAWVCAKAGLYHLSADVWTQDPAVGPCRGLVAYGDEATVATSTQLFRCRQGACAAAAALPASFDPDGVLGEVTDAQGRVVPAVVLGNKVYRFHAAAGAFVDVTPVYAGGSLVLESAARIDAPGLVSMQGGGVALVPPTPIQAWHFRPE